jgi:predicted dehydrogenase
VTIRVALLGCGAWGSNLLRVLEQSARATVVAVADPSPLKRRHARDLSPGAAVVASLDEALALGVDAVVIATPAHTHAALALTALDAGADVFVEKPLAMSIADAERCAAHAEARGRIGMVGHLLRYHPAVTRLVEICRGGALGPLEHVEAARRSVNGDRSASALWTLGPHDLSVIYAIDESAITGVTASGPANGADATVHLTLQSGLTARVALSRAHPVKERRFAVIGRDHAAIFDDVRAPDRVLLGRPVRRRGAPAEIAITGEATVAWHEPLALEIDHFLRCVEERTPPLTGFGDGVRVVRALAAAEGAIHRRDDAAGDLLPLA